MAASKKYGYQLRGDKLSIVELDITGSGSGLNYEYNEGNGLDISTDPSSWKSPLEDIADGLQIEYLSNELTLNTPTANTIIGPSVHLGAGDDFLYINDSLQGVNYWEKFEDIETPQIYELAPRIYPPSADIGPFNMDPQFMVPSVTTIPGAKYNMSGRLTVMAYRYFDEAGVPFGTPYINMGPQTIISHNERLNQVSSVRLNLVYPELYSLPSNFEGYTVSPSQMTPHSQEFFVSFSVTFIAESDSFAPGFVFPVYNLSSGHIVLPNVDSGNEYLYNNQTAPKYSLPDLSLTLHEDTHVDEDLAEITLPPYAQKALLDYVRAQEAYEGGDLEKWNFFMKQFRSKLERWEDSRITGPRVLGPHGPSSIT